MRDDDNVVSMGITPAKPVETFKNITIKFLEETISILKDSDDLPQHFIISVGVADPRTAKRKNIDYTGHRMEGKFPSSYDDMLGALSAMQMRIYNHYHLGED